MNRPTIRDVAHEAGAGIGTVSGQAPAEPTAALPAELVVRTTCGAPAPRSEN